MSAEARIRELGLVLPPPPKLPPGFELPFEPVKICSDKAYASGVIAFNSEGVLLEPLGKVGAEVSSEQAIEAARATGLTMLSALKMALGDLDRIKSWVKVFGMVNGAPDFHDFPTVINGFSHLILEVFGTETGAHARSAVGMGGLPFNTPVEIEAIVELRP